MLDAYLKLVPQAVAFARASGKPDVLSQTANILADCYDVSPHAVLEGLQDREALGSTGFGRGVAIPHARLAELNRPVAIVVRLEKPVDFAAADGLPVELVFGLVSPEGAGQAHLHALAALSRLVRDDSVLESLLAETTPEGLYALLSDAADRDAA
ncbi:PTS sugar transporter subunit IIA [Qipengyuania sp. JC766]|uniref:PTS sugar transporter subunit IIA n=1 Tax=Qipengyuania sp. JC766 TaxID=3232139 RepID=UPI003457BEAC